MKPKIKVKFNNVSKKYNLYKKQSDKLLDMFLAKKRSQSFYALRDISFDVYEGETIGVIGVNGSGKSTLSNLLAQVVPPTSGTIEINGQTSLIAISVGLNNNLSGFENIELKCLMLGMNKSQIKELTPNIIEFADIGDFIYQPVKNYSSGMKSRLGFAISVHTNPDILIVDEALSVGDQTFYEKCLKKINEFKAEGKTIFFISHSISQIRSISDKVLWINHGEIEEFGSVRIVIEKYKKFISWFNELSDLEKKNYKTKNMEKQKMDDLNHLNSEKDQFISRKNIHKSKNDKTSNPFIFAQLSFFTLCTIFSLLFMFIGNPVQIMNKNTTDQSGVKTIDQIEDKKDIIVFEKNGYVIVNNADFYIDEQLTETGFAIPFGSSLEVLGKTDNVYKIRYNDTTGFTSKENIQIGDVKQDNESENIAINEFLSVFPENFKNSYQFYLAQLNLNEEQILEKLSGLTGESVNINGDKTLDYKYDNVQIIIDKETGLTSSIIVDSIQSESDTLNKIKESAQITSKNGDLLFLNLDKYNLTINLINNTIAISLSED
ncbi:MULTISPECIES: teichoic acids export ABC transporter ATP-binding subunit TagH [Metabacillus]|uniref:ABC transporter domain-containing protein n=2 Tax=Metabacillus TaxID=2675233 RepID=A0A179T2A2_9BACI|nr:MULTISPECIES: teichoic acids export ABC transporter ATP-binding subunit TagH [Metabacillus]OAS88216.1 hypothetical protein A6K24_17740 [Metabacillus litoralis]QNF27352.1 teichoic acids export ABC transporter ATP-binding subunit TagH [Metabacillus sp. KUDC1714]